MDNDKTATSSSLGPRVVADRELLMQGHAEDVEDPLKAGPPPASGYNAGREVCLSCACLLLYWRRFLNLSPRVLRHATGSLLSRFGNLVDTRFVMLRSSPVHMAGTFRLLPAFTFAFRGSRKCVLDLFRSCLLVQMMPRLIRKCERLFILKYNIDMP